ncbi:hypothetical protein BGW36DRAFT_401013 [Talaromyces proteolyticus]|uniref:Uncharacterized protein n=1 Tax=Talaromyces proteolyticus TaxID=1131652 RepID=A0AAD4KGG2_9EURO|nr:uncharacterized protein BGW36DRAFT_401013 [Talaromyces proteolyticus]KAH8690590.1 hypothetical protein BGW36DRAFT_401013 [Talaromyces proteolyticus]
MAAIPQNFFDRFPTFRPEPRARISVQFRRLAAHMKWETGSRRWRKMWKECMGSEFSRLYGDNASRLQSWQDLCLDLGLQAPPSITKCKKLLSSVYVNIVDLIDCRAAGEIPRMFSSVAALKEYTRKYGQVFPRELAKEEGFIRILLKKIA